MASIEAGIEGRGVGAEGGHMGWKGEGVMVKRLDPPLSLKTWTTLVDHLRTCLRTSVGGTSY